MQPVPLLVFQSIRPLVRYRERIGAPPPNLPGLLRQGHGLLPLAHGGLLWEDTAHATGDPAVGLRAGAATRYHEIPLGQHVRGSLTVGSALEAAAAASGRYVTSQRLTLTPRGDDVWVQRRFPDALRRGRRQANDFALQLLLDLVRHAAGPAWRPAELRLEGPPPAHAEELAALAARATHFGAAADAVAIPKRILALPLLPAAVADPLRVEALPSDDFTQSIRQAVRALLELGRLDLQAVAEAAGTSARSLQRHLQHAGLSFSRLVDEARFDNASRLLRDPAIRIVDVAAELGYTDSANFTRAFRRWAGVPPRAFRGAGAPGYAAGAR